METPGLVALWDFKEKEGRDRKAIGLGKFPLKEQNGTLPRINEGPLSGYSAQFGNKAFLSLANSKTKELNVFGEEQGVTVIAWLKWEGSTGFVGGMNIRMAGNGNTDYSFRYRITMAATRFVDTSAKRGNQRHLFLIPSIIRQVNK